MKMALGDMQRAEMAAQLGVDPGTLSRWMGDKGAPPKRVYLAQWALITGVPLEWLESGLDSTPTPPDGGRRTSKLSGSRVSAIGLVSGDVELRPIARGNDQRFANGIALQRVGQNGARRLRREREGLALGEGRRAVVHPDDEEMHNELRLPIDGADAPSDWSGDGPRLHKNAGPASLRQGYGGPPELQRRRMSRLHSDQKAA